MNGPGREYRVGDKLRISADLTVTVTYLSAVDGVLSCVPCVPRGESLIAVRTKSPSVWKIERVVEPLVVGDVVAFEDRERLATLPPWSAVRYRTGKTLKQLEDWKYARWDDGSAVTVGLFPVTVAYVPPEDESS